MRRLARQCATFQPAAERGGHQCIGVRLITEMVCRREVEIDHSTWRHSTQTAEPSQLRAHFKRTELHAPALQIATRCLLALDGFKERLEVSLAEAAAALALNDLEEECWTIFDRAREDLQHVA